MTATVLTGFMQNVLRGIFATSPDFRGISSLLCTEKLERGKTRKEIILKSSGDALKLHLVVVEPVSSLEDPVSTRAGIALSHNGLEQKWLRKLVVNTGTQMHAERTWSRSVGPVAGRSTKYCSSRRNCHSPGWPLVTES